MTTKHCAITLAWDVFLTDIMLNAKNWTNHELKGAFAADGKNNLVTNSKIHCNIFQKQNISRIDIKKLYEFKWKKYF